MTDLEFYRSKLKDNTIGAFVRAVMQIDNPEDAARFYRGGIANFEEQQRGGWQSRYTAVEAANANIGWCFGEGMKPERIEMWRAISGARYPVFGFNTPTPQDAFRMGMDLVSRPKV